MAQAVDGRMEHVRVPEGVVEGGTFNHLMPNGMIVPVVVPPGASVGSVLAIPVPAVTAPALAPEKPIRWTRKVRVNTRPVDGMRGFAVMHIVLGHFFLMIDTGAGPDAPPEPAAAAWPETEACPVGWGLHKGMCYSGTCNRKPWEDANAMCGELAKGATLASLDQSQVVLVDSRGGKIDRVQEAWFQGGMYYIGLTERETKGTWAWANGTVAEDLVWAEGEPNDFGGTSEECGVAQVETNAFFDVPCHAEMPYLCSVPARAGLCQGDCTDDDFWEGAPYAKCEYHLGGGEGAGCAQGTIALMGGGSMGFFYIISGFVMVVGYAQLPLRGARTWRESVCGPRCDRICCFPCGAGENEEDIDSLPALDARGFLRKRFARLAPMYFLTMILGVVIRSAIGQIGDALEADLSYVVTTIVFSLFGVTSWFLSFPFCAEWLWTVSTMMFFYLCFPALAPRVQRIKPANLRAFALCMFCLQAAALILAGVVFGTVFGYLFEQPDMGYWARMYPPVRLPIFVMGMCCGMQRLHAEHACDECESQGQGHGHAEQPKPEPAQQVCPVITPLAGCCCLQPVTGLGIYWLLSTLICTSIAFSCSGFIMLRALLELLYPILFYDWILAATDPEQQKSLIARFFASRPMTFLGDISMCMYMLHLHVQSAMSLLLGEGETMPAWVLLVEVPVSVLLGWLFTRFYEKPMAHLLRPRESKKRVGVPEGSAQGLRTTPDEAPSPDVVGAPTTVAVPSKS